MDGHGQVNGWAYLRAHRRSRRSARSSEPGCEAGTRPRDGQGGALSSADPLTGSASVAHNDADGNRPTSARTFFSRPVHVNEANSARRADHVDMRFMCHSNRKVERAHLLGLMEMFERALRAQGNTHLSFHFDHDSSCVIGDPSRSRSRSSSPNVCPCACSCSRVNRKCPATANARRLR